jgi:hypothetical protein
MHVRISLVDSSDEEEGPAIDLGCGQSTSALVKGGTERLRGGGSGGRKPTKVHHPPRSKRIVDAGQSHLAQQHMSPHQQSQPRQTHQGRGGPERHLLGERPNHRKQKARASREAKLPASIARSGTGRRKKSAINQPSAQQCEGLFVQATGVLGPSCNIPLPAPSLLEQLDITFSDERDQQARSR